MKRLNSELRKRGTQEIRPEEEEAEEEDEEETVSGKKLAVKQTEECETEE